MKRNTIKTNRDIYQEVTDKIIAALEAGHEPWKRGWDRIGNDSLPVNVLSNKPYRGTNVFMLWMGAMAEGYNSNLWGTFKQWKMKKASVRKGEHGSQIIFFKIWEAPDTVDPRKTNKIPLIRSSVVFNAEQVDGYEIAVAEPLSDDHIEQIQAAEELHAGWVKSSGIHYHEKGDRAFYRRDTDTVTVPTRPQFHSAQEFYGTSFHEFAHSTGHRKRIDRLTNDGFGSQNYAREELIAEMSAAFLCAQTGVPYMTQHVDYIAHWLTALKNDKKLIVKAAAQAQVAADFINNSIAGKAEEAA